MKDYKQAIKENGFFLIAEIGVNYYDIAKKEGISIIEAAKLMINQAEENGADAVKFQSYKADTIVSKHAPAYWDLEKEPTRTQYQLFKKFDKFEEQDYFELQQYCNKKNIMFLSTPFDYQAVDFLDKLMPIFKISSSDITNLPFIKYIASKNKPIFLSTGAATIGEIETAVQVINENNSCEVVLMHCILDYPTHYKDANLLMIKHLANVFPNSMIGYSDHTEPDERMIVPTIAFLYGAKIIEKHFTLDKMLPGNDHYHAMDPNDLKKLRENLDLAIIVNGDYYKRPIPCEMTSREQARRSIIAKVKISKGELITREKITFKRPGTGISPSMVENVVGGTALVDIDEDEIITFRKVRLVNKE
jgi:sialic acid synthase SpsE